ncbi:MAG: hypothetical protein JXB48_01120 [Candidatus Latescibacteria bacterium]|nr:hypothetical protein [Candidatus Latescibacterota bacterium]
MREDSQFWWNWWVKFGATIATFAAVLIALFGDWIKSHLFSPKLVLSLRNNKGEKTIVTFQLQTEQGQQTQNVDARYYHVKVSNAVRWPIASQTRVFLLSIEEPGPDGELQITWSGELPVQWTHQTIHPFNRTIGPTAYCDLCSVLKDKWIQLHPIIIPNNFPMKKSIATTLVVSLQAKSNEGESAIVRFKIAWDGKWDDGDVEMSHHLVIKEVP